MYLRLEPSKIIILKKPGLYIITSLASRALRNYGESALHLTVLPAPFYHATDRAHRRMVGLLSSRYLAEGYCRAHRRTVDLSPWADLVVLCSNSTPS
jgi:hypothetical protein